MDSRVTRFNKIVGNPPVGIDGTKEEFWKQAELQASLVLEEAKEMHKAAQERNLVEYADGWGDVRYLNEYAETLLSEAEVNTLKVKDMIAENNDHKFTASMFKAEAAKEYHDLCGTPSYVVKVEVEDGVYYVVKRKSDNKVLKFPGHVAPNLKKAISISAIDKFHEEEVVDV